MHPETMKTFKDRIKVVEDYNRMHLTELVTHFYKWKRTDVELVQQRFFRYKHFNFSGSLFANNGLRFLRYKGVNIMVRTYDTSISADFIDYQFVPIQNELGIYPSKKELEDLREHLLSYYVDKPSREDLVELYY